MKKILIVDDEKSFLLSLTDMLKEHNDKFTMLTANNGKEALKVLGSTHIDLIVTDLKMPTMDGFELLAEVGSDMPYIPVIVMTAFGTPAIEDRIQTMGSFSYVEKPIDFNILLKNILTGLDKTAKDSHISGFSVSSFIQLLEHEKKTCTILVNAAGKQGALYFVDGELLDSKAGSLTGTDAAIEIVGWDQPDIKIHNSCKCHIKKIEEPLGFIIIESSRLRDEKMNTAQTVDQVEDKPNGSQNTISEINELDAANLEPIEGLPDSSQILATDETPGTISPKMIKAIMEVRQVNKLIIINREGSILANENIDNPEFGTYLAFVEVAAEQIMNIIGFNEPQYFIMTRITGDKLVITSHADVIIGLEVGSAMSPQLALDHLKNILAEA